MLPHHTKGSVWQVMFHSGLQNKSKCDDTFFPKKDTDWKKVMIRKRNRSLLHFLFHLLSIRLFVLF